MNLKFLFSTLLLFLTFLSVQSQREDEEDEQVEDEFKLISVNEKNYDSIVSAVPHFVLLFHNPWCKFSQNFERKLTNLNKLMKMENQKYFIGAVDSTLVDSKKLISEKIPENVINPLLTYPKMVYFRDGKPVEVYTGKHNKNDIYIYIKRKINPESINLTIMATFESKVPHDKHAFVFFGPKDEKFEIFNKVAKEKLDMMFYHTDEQRIYDKLNPAKNTTVIYYTFGKKKDTFNTNQNFTEVAFSRFVKKNTFVNLYDRVTEEFINEVIMKKQSAVILFRSVYENKTQFLEENFPLMAKGEPSLKFIISDMTGKYELKLANLLNIGVDNLPALRILDFKEGIRKFEMNRDLTMENVMSFIRMWKEGKLHPYTVSQGITEGTKKKEVLKSITSASFYETCVFNRKNVVLFFYTNWCTHCKKVFPVLEAVAKKFSSDLIIFGTFNVEENDVNYIRKNTKTIDKVPLLYLYTIKDKETPIVYPKDTFTVRDIQEFITSNTYTRTTDKSDL